jgi:hypothetical protein
VVISEHATGYSGAIRDLWLIRRRVAQTLERREFDTNGVSVATLVLIALGVLLTFPPVWRLV